jgi:hypothetical protein
MKLASLDDGTSTGLPVVVSSDLSRCAPATSIVGSLTEALDRWDRLADRLWGLAVRLETGREKAWRFHPTEALAPVPTAERLDGGTVTLRPARSSIGIPPDAGLVRTRLQAQALAGRDGRSRFLVLTAILEGAGGYDDPSPVIVCSPVAFTLAALDDASEPDHPLVSRLWRVRGSEVDEVFNVVGKAADLPRGVGKGTGPRLVPMSGFDNLGMIGLREGDLLRACVTDCRRRGVVGTIDTSLGPRRGDLNGHWQAESWR